VLVFPMDWLSLLLLIVAFAVLLKAADYAVRFASDLAALFRISAFVVSFIVVGIVSASPESIIAVIANLQGSADAAAMALIASNIADLALVIGITAFLMRGVAVDATVLRKDALYLGLLVLPLIFAFDGVISRLEGSLLLIGGIVFFAIFALQAGILEMRWPKGQAWPTARTIVLLLLSLGVMLFCADQVVSRAGAVGAALGVPLFLINILVVGIGVCLPELIFAVKSVRSGKSDLALGNVLSVVIIDGTIVLGLIAMMRPLVIDALLMRVTMLFMVLAILFIITFLKADKRLGWQEGITLVALYAGYLLVTILKLT
jgi:cation:H+ antiporter